MLDVTVVSGNCFQKLVPISTVTTIVLYVHGSKVLFCSKLVLYEIIRTRSGLFRSWPEKNHIVYVGGTICTCGGNHAYMWGDHTIPVPF